MKKLKRNRIFSFMSAIVLALALAGCGGGGGGSAEEMPDPAPVPDTRIADAQAAAALAAMAADAALAAAKAAVEGVSNIRDYDSLHYELAGGALDDARRAKQDADAANAAAMAASDADAAEDAQEAAEGARDAAVSAAGEAATKLQELVDSNVGTNVEVHQATLDKADADTAVVAANAALADAINAQTARDLAAAQAAVGAAQQAQMDAEDNRDAIGAVKMGYDDEQQRMSDVADAKGRANTSAMAADADAIKADEAATRVEAIAPGSAGATNARAAATAARNAATTAQAAHDDITDEMSKEDADAKADEAASQAMAANGSYMTASNIKSTTETSLGITQEEIRKRDVAAATRLANDAADDAKGFAGEADEAADAAESARDEAHDAYMKAKAARTDSDEAKKQYEAAKAAAADARTAADDAMQAYMDAKAAAEGIDADGSTADAQAAQGTAEDERDAAEGLVDTAEMKQADAETAMGDARIAAYKHVLGLFTMANAYHINRADDPDANSDESEADLIAKNKANHVAAVNTAIAGTATDQGEAAGTAMWPYEDAATEEEGDGRLMISVTTTAGGSALPFDHIDDEETGEDATQVDERTANVIADLGVFDAFEITQETADGSDVRTGGTRVLAFTNKKQASAPTDAETVNLTNQTVTGIAGVTPTTAPATTGDDIHDFAGTYDHDGNPDTAVLTGTFDCVNPATCSVTRTGTGEAGEHVAGQTTVTAISGYRFTGTGTTPAVASVEDTDYLVFGVWLTETVVPDDINTYTFGAFSDGGDAVEAGDNIVNVKGGATYIGSAAGVRSTNARVDFFSGTATLNAKFGDETGLGAVTGEISNIVAGGVSVSDNIFLYLTDLDAQDATPTNITETGTFSGRARMGAGTLGDDGEYDYPFNGMWSGQFYNPVANDAATTVDESETAPGAATGTFGVTRMDNGATADVNESMSFIGAFGAHKQ